MSAGLYSGSSGLALGTGLAGATGLYSGAAGLASGGSPALSLDFTTGSLDSRITFTRSSLATLFDSTGKLTYAPNNLVTYSEQLDNAAWTKASVSVLANQDGTADKLTTANVAAQNFSSTSVYSASITSLAQKVIVSAKVKSNGLRYCVIGIHNGAGFTSNAVFDLQTGSFVIAGENAAYTSGATGVISGPDADGYYRVSYIGTKLEGSVAFAAVAGSSAYGGTAQRDITGNGTDAILVKEMQAELATYQTAPGTYNATTSAAYHGPRFDYNPSTLAALGLLMEEARTNLCRYSDDLTNASWTKTTMTTAKTATGPDGVSNSATTLTATAGNATALQAITSGSAERITSCWIKRRTGTGNIQMTQDNGTTWTTVTVTSSWTRVSIASATLANPTVGLRIVTNGDAVDVALFQHELGSFITSAIPTASATVTRAVDVATMTGSNFSGWFNASEGAFIVQGDSPGSGTRALLAADDNTANENFKLYTNTLDPKFLITDGGVSQADIDAGSITALTAFKFAAAYKLNDCAASVSGGAAVTDASATMPTVDRARIGSDQAGNTLNGHIKSASYYNTRLTNAQLQTLTT